MIMKLVFLFIVFGIIKGEIDEEFDEEVPSTFMPHLLSGPVIIEATTGESVTFPCEVDDLGNYVMLWKKGKTEVLFAGQLRIHRDERFQVTNNSFSINAVRAKDSGEYICQVSSNPPLELIHTLNVLYPPKVKPNPREGLVTVKEGETVTLSCDASGNPVPKMTWKHAGRNYDISDGSQFTIGNAQKSSSGEYECIADNGVGKPATAIITVEVVSAPVVQPHPRDGVLVVKEGETIEVSCDATGDPVPFITWRTPGETMPHKSREDNSIIISSAERSHAGSYECIANNSLGVSSSALIRVQVLYPPEIRVQNSWIHAGEGTTVNMSCSVRGEPIPSVTWKKADDGTDIHSNGHYHLKTSGHHHILQIRHLKKEDFVRYECVAKNPLRVASEGIQIVGTPQVPFFTSEPHSPFATKHTLSWKVKSHSPVDEYSLMYRKKLDTEEWAAITVAADKDTGLQTYTYDLDNLEPGTTYEAVVTARNKFGWSKPSEAFDFVTKREAEVATDTMSSGSTDDSETKNSNEQSFRTGSSSHLQQSLFSVIVQAALLSAFYLHHY